MASFSAGTTFTDGVANDVTAAKLAALVNNATPTSGLIQDRTAETIIATNDAFLFGDASDSNNLKRITVANFTQTLPTAKVTTGTIETGTFGTTTSTAAIITTGTIPTLTAGTTTSTAATITAATITTGTIPTLVATTMITSGTGTATSPAIVPTGDTNTGIFFPAADTIAFSDGGTEAMRIDSSGNVGIGITSPNQKLVVVGASSDTETIRVITGSNAGIQQTTGIGFGFTSGATNPSALIQAEEFDVVDARASIVFSTNNTGTDVAPTERMRISSAGNVSIGTATALSTLHVHGNLTLSNTTTATSAGTSTITPPATVAGYLTVSINGTSRKIPYYAT